MIRLKIASDSLKLMALIAMTLDHIDKILGFGGYLGCTIGRTAFPIFAYLLIQHFCVFHPVKKYPDSPSGTYPDILNFIL